MNIETIDLAFTARPWQAAVLRQAQRKRFSIIAVHRQAGKTELVIMRLLDAALRNGRGDARYAYISPLRNQSKAICWDRLKARALQVPGTVVNEGELWCQFSNGARVRLFGADAPDNLRGLVLDGVVLDEVSQMPLQVWGEILLPCLAYYNGWALLAGTPKGVNLFSHLFHRALGDPEWFAALYPVTATQALSPEQVEQLQRELTPSQFRQELLCEWSASSDDKLITIDDATAAMRRRPHQREYLYAPKILGVDIAWQGGDRCVMFPRQGLMAWQPTVAQGLPEKEWATRVAMAIQKWHPDAVFVDTTGGYGGEVVSRLRDWNYTVEGIVFSAKASEDRFLNMRAEMYWKLAKWIKDGGSIPNDPGLVAELCAPSYSNDNAANKLKIESKDDIRARLGVSPDKSDALCLTFAYPVMARLRFGESFGNRLLSATTSDHDPFAEDAAAERRRVQSG